MMLVMLGAQARVHFREQERERTSGRLRCTSSRTAGALPWKKRDAARFQGHAGPGPYPTRC
jgi:hypothetical protein